MDEQEKPGRQMVVRVQGVGVARVAELGGVRYVEWAGEGQAALVEDGQVVSRGAGEALDMWVERMGAGQAG